VIIQRVKRSKSFSGVMSLAAIWLVSMAATGCATSKDVDALRAEASDQIATVRSDVAQTRQAVEAVKADMAQTRQAVEAVKADVAQVKSLGAAVDSLKGRLDNVQLTVQGLQTEAETQRTAQLRQFQVEVALARERIKQMEQLIEDLQKTIPSPRKQEGGTTLRN
jgi:chromosome segregation ATPase